MDQSSHQSAIDQARLLVAYLDGTPSPDLDLRFIGHHLEALSEFAWAAHSQSERNRQSSVRPLSSLPAALARRE